MIQLFANSGDSDQMPHSAASNLSLHCLPITPLRVSRLQRVNNSTSNRLIFDLDILSFNSKLHLLFVFVPLQPTK